MEEMESPSSSLTSPSSTQYQNNKNSLKQPSSFPTSTQIWSSIKGKTCPICLSLIAGRRPAVIAACLHAYCHGCLLRWTNYKRTCPLCNSLFHSYFSLSSSSPTFQKHRLLPLNPPADPPRRRESRPSPMAVQRVLRRRREEINAAHRRSRTVPHRRSFRQLGSLSSEEIAERVLQWRASIYRLGLKAVPFENRDLPNRNMTMSTIHKEHLLQKIEPWIRRELQAILQDPDPTIIVHVATSLYLSSIETMSSGCPDTEDTLLAPLRPFLHEWTTTFWHELRCFAESPYTMDTYDEVVEYRRSD